MTKKIFIRNKQSKRPQIPHRRRRRHQQMKRRSNVSINAGCGIIGISA